MKKITLICITILYSITFYAQTTAIPDANFEQALIDLGLDSGAIDGSVPTANISSITDLDVFNKNISDLTGIADFTSLEILNCRFNNLSDIDLSQNTNLTELNIENNNLSDLDVSQNTALTYLNCNTNQLTALDVTNNINLLTLEFGLNSITSIDLSQNTLLTNLFCGQNHLTALDVSHNIALTSLVCGTYNQITTLDISQNTNLTVLKIKNLPLSSLDVSQNTALIELDCGNNNLTSIDLNQNTALEKLNCSHNDLTSLDISQNLALTDLRVVSNQLTTLDLRNHINLNTLFCFSNQLTYLNVKNGNNINFNSFNATYNPDLTCIEVDDANWSTANWTNIDAQTSFSTDCDNLSVEDESIELFSIYPNPANTTLFIKNNTNNSIIKASLFNAIGQKVWSAKGGVNAINVENFSKGIYMLTVQTTNKISSKQILIN